MTRVMKGSVRLRNSSSGVVIERSHTVTVDDLKVLPLFNEDFSRNNVPFPKVKPLGYWDDSKPHIALSADGVTLVMAYLDFLKMKAHVCTISNSQVSH